MTGARVSARVSCALCPSQQRVLERGKDFTWLRAENTPGGDHPTRVRHPRLPHRKFGVAQSLGILGRCPVGVGRLKPFFPARLEDVEVGTPDMSTGLSMEVRVEIGVGGTARGPRDWRMMALASDSGGRRSSKI